ncbi:MAG: hypothetical protein AB9861_00295 [Methanosarcina sp.]|jgi:hypothetical protein
MKTTQKPTTEETELLLCYGHVIAQKIMGATVTELAEAEGVPRMTLNSRLKKYQGHEKKFDDEKIYEIKKQSLLDFFTMFGIKGGCEISNNPEKLSDVIAKVFG